MIASSHIPKTISQSYLDWADWLTVAAPIALSLASWNGSVWDDGDGAFDATGEGAVCVGKDGVGVGDGDVTCVCSIEHPVISASRTTDGAAVKRKDSSIDSLGIAHDLVFAKA